MVGVLGFVPSGDSAGFTAGAAAVAGGASADVAAVGSGSAGGVGPTWAFVGSAGAAVRGGSGAAGTGSLGAWRFSANIRQTPAAAPSTTSGKRLRRFSGASLGVAAACAGFDTGGALTSRGTVGVMSIRRGVGVSANSVTSGRLSCAIGAAGAIGAVFASSSKSGIGTGIELPASSSSGAGSDRDRALGEGGFGAFFFTPRGPRDARASAMA